MSWRTVGLLGLALVAGCAGANSGSTSRPENRGADGGVADAGAGPDAGLAPDAGDVDSGWTGDVDAGDDDGSGSSIDAGDVDGSGSSIDAGDDDGSGSSIDAGDDDGSGSSGDIDAGDNDGSCSSNNDGDDDSGSSGDVDAGDDGDDDSGSSGDVDAGDTTAGGISVHVTFVDTAHQVRALDRDGALLATSYEHGSNQLYASADEGRSWQHRGSLSAGSYRVIALLPTGTLLADIARDGADEIVRSDDDGRSWEDVLALGGYRLLQPHNIVQLGGTVFLGEYQTFAKIAPVHLWASDDDGRTWTVRYEFDQSRHIHGLVADDATDTLYALLGDSSGGFFRSLDEGASFDQLMGSPDGVGVDGILMPDGVLFAHDAIYRPAVPGVQFVGFDGTTRVVAPLPGPAYSVMKVDGGGYLMGITRESDGDVYAPDDVSAHLYGSADAETWVDLGDYPRLTSSVYARADVYWQLPSGEVVLELSNVQSMGSVGAGFELLEVSTDGP